VPDTFAGLCIVQTQAARTLKSLIDKYTFGARLRQKTVSISKTYFLKAVSRSTPVATVLPGGAQSDAQTPLSTRNCSTLSSASCMFNNIPFCQFQRFGSSQRNHRRPKRDALQTAAPQPKNAVRQCFVIADMCQTVPRATCHVWHATSYSSRVKTDLFLNKFHELFTTTFDLSIIFFVYTLTILRSNSKQEMILDKLIRCSNGIRPMKEIWPSRCHTNAFTDGEHVPTPLGQEYRPSPI
jgi:hypothetical protein